MAEPKKLTENVAEVNGYEPGTKLDRKNESRICHGLQSSKKLSSSVSNWLNCSSTQETVHSLKPRPVCSLVA